MDSASKGGWVYIMADRYRGTMYIDGLVPFAMLRWMSANGENYRPV